MEVHKAQSTAWRRHLLRIFNLLKSLNLRYLKSLHFQKTSSQSYNLVQNGRTYYTDNRHTVSKWIYDLCSFMLPISSKRMVPGCWAAGKSTEQISAEKTVSRTATGDTRAMEPPPGSPEPAVTDIIKRSYHGWIIQFGERIGKVNHSLDVLL